MYCYKIQIEQLIGKANDMFAESRNDKCKYTTLANQEDYDKVAFVIMHCGNSAQNGHVILGRIGVDFRVS